MPKTKLLTGAPILILQGTADTHVSYRRCDTFKSTFSNAAVFYYKDVHHGFDKEGIDRTNGNRIMRWNQTAAEDARARVAAFFAKELRATPRS